MKKYIYLGCGGFMGAVLRYILENVTIKGYNDNLPLNTLLINICGAFLMGMIVTLALEVWVMNADIRLGVTTGFLGAFTTFSTLCKEILNLLKEGYYFSAVTYGTLSLILGLGAACLGVTLGMKLSGSLCNEEETVE